MSVDRRKVIELLAKVKLKGDEDGLIPAFNVYLNRLPSSFWNSFAEKLTRQVDPELMEAAEYLLVNAGQECGYHTGYGIITSEEWRAVVEPMIEKYPEDMIHGLFAIFTSWGWAKIEAVELIPDERLVVRAYNYYESDVVRYGKSDKFNGYMLAGVSAAFMDLAYGKPFPDGLRTFSGRQVKGFEKGDDYGEFVVEKIRD